MAAVSSPSPPTRERSNTFSRLLGLRARSSSNAQPPPTVVADDDWYTPYVGPYSIPSPVVKQPHTRDSWRLSAALSPSRSPAVGEHPTHSPRPSPRGSPHTPNRMSLANLLGGLRSPNLSPHPPPQGIKEEGGGGMQYATRRAKSPMTESWYSALSPPPDKSRASPASNHTHPYAASGSAQSTPRRAPPVLSPGPGQKDFAFAAGSGTGYAGPYGSVGSGKGKDKVPAHLRPHRASSVLKALSTPNLRALAASSSGVHLAPTTEERMPPLPQTARERLREQEEREKGLGSRWLSPETWCDALLFPRPRFRVRTDSEMSMEKSTVRTAPRAMSPATALDSPLLRSQPSRDVLNLRDRDMATVTIQIQSPHAGPSMLPQHHQHPPSAFSNLSSSSNVKTLSKSRSAHNLRGSQQHQHANANQPPKAEPVLNIRGPNGRPRSFAADDLALPSPVPSLARVIETQTSFAREREAWKAQASSGLLSKHTRSISRARARSLSRAHPSSSNLKDEVPPPLPRFQTLLLGGQTRAATVHEGSDTTGLMSFGIGSLSSRSAGAGVGTASKRSAHGHSSSVGHSVSAHGHASAHGHGHGQGDARGHARTGSLGRAIAHGMASCVGGESGSPAEYAPLRNEGLEQTPALEKTSYFGPDDKSPLLQRNASVRVGENASAALARMAPEYTRMYAQSKDYAVEPAASSSFNLLRTSPEVLLVPDPARYPSSREQQTPSPSGSLGPDGEGVFGIAISTPSISPVDAGPSPQEREEWDMPDHPYAGFARSKSSPQHHMHRKNQSAGSGSEYAGPHPSSPVVNVPRDMVVDSVVARHRLPPHVRHPYAFGSRDEDGGVPVPILSAPKVGKGKARAVVETYEERGGELEVEEGRDARGRPLSAAHAYARAARESATPLDFGEAVVLALARRRRGSVDSGLGDSVEAGTREDGASSSKGSPVIVAGAHPITPRAKPMNVPPSPLLVAPPTAPQTPHSSTSTHGIFARTPGANTPSQTPSVPAFSPDSQSAPSSQMLSGLLGRSPAENWLAVETPLTGPPGSRRPPLLQSPLSHANSSRSAHTVASSPPASVNPFRPDSLVFNIPASDLRDALAHSPAPFLALSRAQDGEGEGAEGDEYEWTPGSVYSVEPYSPGAEDAYAARGDDVLGNAPALARHALAMEGSTPDSDGDLRRLLAPHDAASPGSSSTPSNERSDSVSPGQPFGSGEDLTRYRDLFYRPADTPPAPSVHSPSPVRAEVVASRLEDAVGDDDESEQEEEEEEEEGGTTVYVGSPRDRMHEFGSPRAAATDLSSPRSIPLEFDAASRSSRAGSGLTNLTRQLSAELGALQEEIRYRPSFGTSLSSASGDSASLRGEDVTEEHSQRWGSRLGGLYGERPAEIGGAPPGQEPSPTAPLRMHAFAPPRISIPEDVEAEESAGSSRSSSPLQQSTLSHEDNILRVGAIEAALTPEAVEQYDHRFSRHLSISGASQLAHFSSEPSSAAADNGYSPEHNNSALERADAVGDTFGPRAITLATPTHSPEIAARTVSSSPESSYLRPSGPTPGARPGVPTPGSSVSTLSVYASSNVRGRDYGYFAGAAESAGGYTSAVETPGAYVSARETPNPYSSSRETPGPYASALDTPGLYSGQATPGPYVSARETPLQHTSTAEDTDAEGYFTADNTTELGHGLGNVDYFASDAYSTADETEMGSDELTRRFDMVTGPYRRSESPVYVQQNEHRVQHEHEPEQDVDSGGETEESVVRPMRDFSNSVSPSLRRLSAMGGISPLGARSSVSSGLVPPRSAHTERSRSSYLTNGSSDVGSRMSGLSDFPVPPDYAYDPRPSLESRPSIDADAESEAESDVEATMHSRSATVRPRRTSRVRESIMNRF
ncbi:unnamed protein product [Peniophora sp. CBMAI 1063]|nr:unnamed protein product [Peniophora sp. CBMAI 1063]